MQGERMTNETQAAITANLRKAKQNADEADRIAAQSKNQNPKLNLAALYAAQDLAAAQRACWEAEL